MTRAEALRQGQVGSTNGADPRPSPSIPMLTRLLICVDVFVHRKLVLSLAITLTVIVASVVPCGAVLVWLARIDPRLAIVAWLAASLGLSATALCITDRLAHRIGVRAARPDEVMALRRYRPDKD